VAHGPGNQARDHDPRQPHQFRQKAGQKSEAEDQQAAYADGPQNDEDRPQQPCD